MNYFNRILLPFTVLPTVMLYLQILQEERHLSVVFGEKDISYQEKVADTLDERDQCK